MPRQRSPDRETAKRLWLERGGKRELKDIAAELNLSDVQIRKWKSIDEWERELKSNVTNQTGVTNGNVTFEEKSRYPKTEKSSTIENQKKVNGKKLPDENSEKQKTKTKTQPSKARFGNQNAKGNKGGRGGPPLNKHALKNGEYENIFFKKVLKEGEQEILDADYDKYILQYLLIDTLTIREKRIMERILEAENTQGGMVLESVTKEKGSEITHYLNRNKSGEEWDGNDETLNLDSSSQIIKPVVKRVMELEEALTRVQGKKLAAISQLHKMQQDDERLFMDEEKLELIKQRLSGRVDLDDLFGGDDLELDLDGV